MRRVNPSPLIFLRGIDIRILDGVNSAAHTSFVLRALVPYAIRAVLRTAPHVDIRGAHARLLGVTVQGKVVD